MFVTETITIDPDKLANTISLEDLIRLKNKQHLNYYHSTTICNLIIMKKLSDYLKCHSTSNLYRLSLTDLLYKIKTNCSNMNGTILVDEYKIFIENFNGCHDIEEEHSVLFYADRAIKKIESEFIWHN